MKFFSIKIGESFFIEEKKAGKVVSSVMATKSSALGYTLSTEFVLGEHSIEPQTDAKIVTQAEKNPPAAPPAKPAVRPFTTVKPVALIGKAPVKGVATARPSTAKAPVAKVQSKVATKPAAVKKEAVKKAPEKKAAAKKTPAKKAAKKQ
jgi:hypothetical protein